VNKKNHIGKRFGRLVAISRIPKFKQETKYLCHCVCGNFAVVKTGNLASRNTSSCGCLKFKVKKPFNQKIHSVYSGMIDRCYNEEYHAYHRYGGRGIKVCKSWLNSYGVFYEWCFENGWSDGLQIDRRNNNAGYYPFNVRFVTRKQNMNNTSSNNIIEFDGKTMNLTQWAEYLGISEDVLSSRINYCKWSYEKALTTPVKKYKWINRKVKN